MHSVVFLDGLFNLPLAGKEKKEKKNVLEYHREPGNICTLVCSHSESLTDDAISHQIAKPGFST